MKICRWYIKSWRQAGKSLIADDMPILPLVSLTAIGNIGIIEENRVSSRKVSMNTNDLKQIQMYRQHLTDKTDKLSVCRDLNGLQAQYMVNAFHGLRIRSNETITADNFGIGLVKNWSVRGTVHVFREDDLPLFKHKSADNSDYLSKNWNGYRHYITKEWTLTSERQRYFSDLIIQKVNEGICTRDDLRETCISNGMTQPEHDSMFSPWGGGLRELCERGFLCYKVKEKKEFMICPSFTPIETRKAMVEQAKRYFTSFAPATIKDAAYYFGWTQTVTKKTMADLSLEPIKVEDKEYYTYKPLENDYPDIPPCILLAGFDQLLLGYQKKESIYLPPTYLRGIFNLAGIVMPPILLNGNVVGRWRKKNRKITFELFESLNAQARKHIKTVMDECFDDIKKVEWIEM